MEREMGKNEVHKKADHWCSMQKPINDDNLSYIIFHLLVTPFIYSTSLNRTLQNTIVIGTSTQTPI